MVSRAAHQHQIIATTPSSRYPYHLSLFPTNPSTYRQLLVEQGFLNSVVYGLNDEVMARLGELPLIRRTLAILCLRRSKDTKIQPKPINPEVFCIVP